MKDNKGKDKQKKVKTDVSYRLKYLQTYTLRQDYQIMVFLYSEAFHRFRGGYRHNPKRNHPNVIKVNK